MFKMLSDKSLYEVGLYYELDKHYSTPASVRSKVRHIYNEVKVDPEKFGISKDTAELIITNVSGRKIKVNGLALREKVELVTNKDIKSITIGGRNTAMRLINTKLAALERSPKALKNESLVSLGKIFGILFDKSQIIQGQATEHVAHLGKIDTNLTPDQAIAFVLKMRENQLAGDVIK